jgi:hypothetical protein
MTHPPRPSAGLSESRIEFLGSLDDDEAEASRPHTFAAHEAHPRGELPQPQVSARSHLRSELMNGSPDRRRPKNRAKIVMALSATHTRMETCRDIPYLCRAPGRDVLSLP